VSIVSWLLTEVNWSGKRRAMGIFRKKATDYFEVAFHTFVNAANASAQSRFDHDLWNAWAKGAVEIRYGLKEIPVFNMTPDSLDKAKRLFELYLQPMISLWFHDWESKRRLPDEEKASVRKVAFNNVQAFLGISSENAVKFYIGFDREFQSFMGKERKPFYYVGMFYQRYCECLTGERIVDWSKLEFPIKSSAQFLNACDASKYHYDFDKNPTPQRTQVIEVLISAGASMLHTLESRLEAD